MGRRCLPTSFFPDLTTARCGQRSIQVDERAGDVAGVAADRSSGCGGVVASKRPAAALDLARLVELEATPAQARPASGGRLAKGQLAIAELEPGRGEAGRDGKQHGHRCRRAVLVDELCPSTM